jgi:uncharacterized protein (TIGR02453 family)
MSQAFTGFGPGVFAWFAGLERENTRAYFAATRDVYEDEVRGGLTALLDELAETFGGDVKVFRQQRDLRFTPDRTPYKDRTYGLLQGAGVTGKHGLYAEVSARGLYAGTGYPHLDAAQLERYRAAVDDAARAAGLEAALAGAQAAGLALDGAAVRTTPRGWPKDHPRIALLRRKALILGARRPPGANGITRAAALKHASSAWRAAAPAVAWLDEHVGPAT